MGSAGPRTGLSDAWSSALCPPASPSHVSPLAGTLQWALGRVPWLPTSVPALSSGPSQAPCPLSPYLSLLVLPPVHSAEPAWPPLLWPLTPTPLLSQSRCSLPRPCSGSSLGVQILEPPWCVHAGGHGSVESNSTSGRGIRASGMGALETPPSATPSPLPLLNRASRRSHPLGVFVREAISEGVLWLGWPRERLAQVPQR